MRLRELGKTGMKVSVLGYGASPLSGNFRPVDEAEGIRTVHAALELGINYLDVSPYYGLTRAETVLGRALQGVPRDRYYLATKVGRYGAEVADCDFSAVRVTASVDESLARLQVDYVDVIQVHDIEFGNLDQIVNETLPALRRVQELGKARFVGITGLPLKAFRYVLDRASADTILSYCHFSLNDTALADFVPYLQARSVGIVNASPLSMGLLSNRGAPAWHPAPAEVKAACARAAALCREQGVDIAQLAIQFSTSNPDLATTLVGTASPDNIEKNVRWLDMPFDRDLLSEVLRILEPVHNVTWPQGRLENN